MLKNLLLYQGLHPQKYSTQEFCIMEPGLGFYMIIQKLNLKIQEGKYETQPKTRHSSISTR